MNDYIEFGRTLARGNDSLSFGGESLTGNEERYGNELCHLNIFTWLGLIGVILYTLIYVLSTWLALYKSRSSYLKHLALLVAFHWAFGWIEDVNTFIPMNFALWMVIGICLSTQFRNMTNKEFEIWFKSIFSSCEVVPYHMYNFVKCYFSMKFISEQKN